MRHASNAKIIRISILLTRIGDFILECNPEEVYKDFKQLTSNNNIDTKITQKTLQLITPFIFYSIKSNFNIIYMPCIASK